MIRHSRVIQAWIIMSIVWVGTIVWQTYGLAAAGASESAAVSMLTCLALATAPPIGLAFAIALAWVTGLLLEAVLFRFPQQSSARKVPKTASPQGMR
jgi:hypothetical protein